MDAYAVMVVYFRLVDAGAILRRCNYCKAIPYIVKNYFIGVFPSSLWVACGRVWTMFLGDMTHTRSQ